MDPIQAKQDELAKWVSLRLSGLASCSAGRVRFVQADKARICVNDLRALMLRGAAVMANIARMGRRSWPVTTPRVPAGTHTILTALMLGTGRLWRTVLDLHEPGGVLLALIEEPAAFMLRSGGQIDSECQPLPVKAFLRVVIVSLQL